MKHLILTFLLVVTLIAPAGLQAHDASKHKGKGTAGEIISVADDRFALKSATGTVTVTLSQETRIEHGKAMVDRTHLLKGGKVTVFGAKLPGGELAAREIIISDPSSAKDKTSKHSESGSSHSH